MSIRKMIALHPASKDHLNQPLGDAVHHLMYCAKMCLSCADACMAEKMDMTHPPVPRLFRHLRSDGAAWTEAHRRRPADSSRIARALRADVRAVRRGVRAARS
jgi:hypothetical protein